MWPIFDYGDAVRVIRNIRNDGTYPSAGRGELLVRRGSVGYVRNLGVFLQDQIIYSVHFFELGGIIVGCREPELIAADAPWIPSRFEFLDKVIARVPLAVGGEVVVEAGGEGEVFKVLPDRSEEVMYHVVFAGRTLRVPETVLERRPTADGSA
jgi:nitrogen fixation protein NifZ